LIVLFIFFFSCIDSRSVDNISFSKQIITNSILTKIGKTNQDFYNDLNQVVSHFGGLNYYFYNISYKSIYEYLIYNNEEYKKITFNEFVYIFSNLEKEIYKDNI
jgi:hypothetical protein